MSKLQRTASNTTRTGVQKSAHLTIFNKKSRHLLHINKQVQIDNLHPLTDSQPPFPSFNCFTVGPGVVSEQMLVSLDYGNFPFLQR